MSKIKLIVDSTHDLPQQYLDDHGIVQVPLNIVMDGKTYIDQEEITSEEYLKQLVTLKDIPKTSQPPTGKFAEIYEKYIDEGYEILSLHMTHRLSGTVGSAQTAAGMVNGKVTVVDSGFIAQSYGFIIQNVAELIIKHKSMDEIVAAIDTMKHQSRLFLVISQLDYLRKGGRISRGKGFIGGLMNLKPVAEVIDGEIQVIQNARTQNAVVKLLTKEVAKMADDYKYLRIGISQADAMDLLEKIKASIEQYTDEKISINTTTPIVSTHTGPGAIGLSVFGYND
ncbi:DegV family protein [Macrococcoides bohemicum]|uniref:DegV family protein n=2 Tax=Macrococcoides bohemicum TaxID=1903056 RepID=A0A328AAJ9_9STAP|nr:DegV family protein [Macrococcus bohemicus]QRN49910.1 DegV family protein [Macrococcus bohemicus]QYA41377.1 DegV family protein [Macrococcus bohemicus]QYA43801.1 DegV family protein [Macrococcus bohemicus]RAK50504.1 fatty acid-binding protein DegV [Macrococcus bohemicus]TDL40398.1 DegV family protein [Macrococcus bohemicus]